MRAIPALFFSGIATFAASLPAGFEPNAGRFDSAISFVAQTREYSVSLEPGAVRYQLTGRDQKRGTVVVKFPGSHAAGAVADGPSLGHVNYFLGNNPERWARDLDEYGRVRYPNLWDGIDLALYEKGGRLEHDFIVRPGADPRAIAMTFAGGSALGLSSGGALLVGTKQGRLRFEPPALYQEIDGKRAAVAGGYRLDRSGRMVRFDVGGYDHSRALVIDPTVVFSVNLTGSGVETGVAVTSDAQGNMYIAGVTTSKDLQTLSPAQPAFGGGIGDCFVAKWDATGKLIYSTYLGGSSQDQPQQILVDPQGEAVILGFTHSPDFPAVNPLPSGGYTPPGTDPANGKAISFIAKLDPTGSKLVYSTLLWSNNLKTFDSTGMALDSAGNAYITGFDALVAAGSAGSPRLTPTPGSYKSPNLGVGTLHAWVAKLSTSGALIWDAVIGGSQQEQASGIDVDSNGAVYVAGYTSSSNFPVTANNGVQQALASKGGGNAFLAVLNPEGSQLVYGTYFGGSGIDIASAVSVIPGVGVEFAGRTTSSDFPVTANADQKTPMNMPSGFHVVLRPPGLTIPVPAANGGASPLGIAGSGPVETSAFATDPVRGLFISLGNLTGEYFEGLIEAASGGSMVSWVYTRKVHATGPIQAVSIQPPNNTYASTINWGDQSGASVDHVGLFDSSTVVSRAQPERPSATTAGGTAVGLRVSYLAAVNAASFATSAVSPGEIVTLFGDNLGPSTLATAQLDSTGQKLSSSVAGTQVFFDTDPAPVVYTSAGQVSVIVPYSIQGKTSVGVFPYYNGVLQDVGTIQVAASAPGIFTADGKQAAALNQDGSYNTASNPAGRGSTVVLFATGEGQTSPAGVDGQIANNVYPKPMLAVSVTIGGQMASLAYYGAAPGETAGLMQLNAVVPENIPAGNAAVVLTVGTVSSQAGVTIAVN